MADFPKDIFTEPEFDPDTLANLGPLSGMGGIREGLKGTDEHPVAEGSETSEFLERYELQPIDPQTNGPQLYYGLRYHTHIVKPGEVQASYEQETLLQIPGRADPFRHTDRNTLRRIAPPTPNPTAGGKR